jgi:hypothetical protein
MEEFVSKIYNPEDKTIKAWYYLKNQTQSQVTLLNVQEKKNEDRVWASGAIDYKLYVKEVRLPKSQIEILEGNDDKEGYFLFKIPYWLFKKNDDLDIFRVSGQKKFSMLPNDVLYSKFSDIDYLKAMTGADTNMERIEVLHKQRLKFENFKSTQS